MRPILIQGAMEVEVAVYLEQLTEVTEKTIGGHQFYYGFYMDYPVIVALTQIGMVNCAVSTTLVASQSCPCLIINQGVAGSHHLDLHVGDIVIGEYVKAINSFEKPLCPEGVQYEKWVAREFFTEKAARKADPDLVQLFDEAVYSGGKKISGVLGCGDVWNREWEFIHWLHTNLGTDTEDMESLSCYQVAADFEIPVVGLRIISNNERTKEEYVPEVGKDLQKFILEQFPKLITWAKEMGD